MNTRARSLHLTSRQREVLSLLCEGLPNKLICRRLNICPGTVKIHVGCILRALGAANRLQAVVIAQRLGLDRATPQKVSARYFDRTVGEDVVRAGEVCSA